MAVSTIKSETKTPKHGGTFLRLRHFLLLLATLLLTLAIFSHAPGDYAVIQGGSDGPPSNWIGSVGANLSCLAFYLFGLGSYVLVVVLALGALRIVLPRGERRHGYWPGVLVLTLGATLLFALNPNMFVEQTEALGIGRQNRPESVLSGGTIGQVLVAPQADQLPPGCLRQLIGPVGSAIVGWALTLLGVLLIYLTDWRDIVKWALQRRESVELASKPAATLSERLAIFHNVNAALKELCRRPEPAAAVPAADALPVNMPIPAAPPQAPLPPVAPPPPPVPPASVPVPAPVEDEAEPEPEPAMVAKTPPARPYANPFARVENRSVEASAAGEDDILTTAPIPNTEPLERGKDLSAPRGKEFVLPPASMLSRGFESNGESPETIEASKAKLQRTLQSFKVDATVTGHLSGPRITRFEVSLEEGVKVDKISKLDRNIAMDLEAKHVRILAPIPGRNVVGVEVPNREAQAVFLRSVMESQEWLESRGEIPIVLGKDVSGKAVVLDLARAPHLLIAGATGSGKSVCMNTLIMSLLFKFKPDELRLILVDPKVVEMEAYKTLPHLITPVVNDASKVPLALRWAVNEMERRYRVLAAARVKNLKGFNSRPQSGEIQWDDEGQPIPEKMPVLIIILDELADVMMSEAKGDVETSIAKIAQKGRAAGIHIVIATQRPSTNIITGVIKANLPTRIAFQVGSLIDSRVILDKPGAETLLGRGDMLFVPPGCADLERIQGAMVDDADIIKIVEFISSQCSQQFDTRVVAEEKEDGDGDEASIDDAPEYGPLVERYLQPGDDSLVARALEVIVVDRKASTSYLQRRLKIGYNRAAELIDLFEERGLVGPAQPGGNKREVLIFDEFAE